MKTLKLSPLETKIVGYLVKGEVSVTDLADWIFLAVPGKYRPANPNNSIVSAIRQINRKKPGTIKGVSRGRNGKLVHLSKPALRYFETTLA